MVPEMAEAHRGRDVGTPPVAGHVVGEGACTGETGTLFGAVRRITGDGIVMCMDGERLTGFRL